MLAVAAYVGSVDDLAQQAEAAIRSGDQASAVQLLQEAEQAQPASPAGDGRIGFWFAVLGNREEAISLFQRAIGLDASYDVPELLSCERWLQVKTAGVKSNRSGIGARIFCTPEGGHRQINEVRSGGSYISRSELRVHFGLSKARPADLDIHWPSGHVDTISNIKANQTVRVMEGQGIA